MYKLAVVAAVAAVLGASSMSAAADAGSYGHHHHHAVRSSTAVAANPAVRGGYVMNGAFDWRRRRPDWNPPWYASGYSGNCYAWTPHAYHYACDPNSRY